MDEAPPEPNKRMARFASSRSRPKLAPEKVKRQSEVSRLALSIFANADAMAFLNTHDDALGGRPLDVAMDSDEGLAAVQQTLNSRRSTR